MTEPAWSPEELKLALDQAIKLTAITISPDGIYLRADSTGSDRVAEFPELSAYLKSRGNV